MDSLTGRIAWEYGLAYGTGPRRCEFSDGELQGMLVMASRIGVWRTEGTHIEWLDHDLAAMYKWWAPGSLRDAWAVDALRWAAIVDGRLLVLDESDRIERVYKLPDVESWRLGCTVDAGTVCLVAEASLLTLRLSDGTLHLRRLPDGLSGISGLACHDNGRWLAMTHAANNVAWLLERDSGQWRQLAGGFEPGGTRLQLHAPRACAVDGDCVWIADSNNNRVLGISLTVGTTRRGIEKIVEGDGTSQLWRPVAVQPLGESQLLILDSKNRRLLKVDEHGQLVSQTGPAVVTDRHLHLPRSITQGRSGELIVCDSHRDRILSLRQLSPGLVEPTVRHSAIAWPRHAVELGDDLLAVSAHAATPLRIDPLGQVHAMALPGFDLPALRDPHQIVVGTSGTLVVNSGGGEIIAWRSGETLHVREVLGKPLSDPHATDFTYEGGIVIADTGNDRLLVSDPSWRHWREIHEIRLPDRRLTLRQPRFVSRERDSHYLVIDTGSRLVVRTDIEGEGAWAFGSALQIDAGRDAQDQPDSTFTWDLRLFHDPRWVISPTPGQLIVSDTGNCRVLSIHLNQAAR